MEPSLRAEGHIPRGALKEGGGHGGSASPHVVSCPPAMNVLDIGSGAMGQKH